MLINQRYKVIRSLGEGGFGHAYITEDTQMPSRRQCVVKQLKPVTAGSEIYQVVQQRFEREAAILERLGEDHPQIPRLYAYFSENQQFYLVQEWIEGQTLEEVASRGVLGEAEVIPILRLLLTVLDFIHGQGVIHRDIKPDNVILRLRNQQPVLIDFGAMRETMGTVFNSRHHPTSSIVIGTPGYMASEQAAGRPIPSSDLYSLGLVAIYLLTGKSPQELPSDPQSGEIIWKDLAVHVSPALVGVLDRAVQFHPRDRYSSARAMQADLPGSSAAFNLAATVLGSPPVQPPAASAIKTVAIAGVNSDYQNSTYQNSTYQQSEQNTALGSDRSNASGGVRPARNLSPWLLGAIAASVGAIAIGAGLFFSRLSGDSTIQSASVESTQVAKSPDKSPDEPFAADSNTPDTNSPDELADNSDISPDTYADGDTQPAPSASSDEGATTLVGEENGQIDVYEQPSFASASPHYGVSGDRVLTLSQTTNSEGTWQLVRFESGAEGWIPARSTANSPPPTPAPPAPTTTPAPTSPAPAPPTPALPTDSPPDGQLSDKAPDAL